MYIMNVELSKGYKMKNRKYNDKEQWKNMHKWRGFVITDILKFTCMILCMLIVITYQRRNNFHPS